MRHRISSAHTAGTGRSRLASGTPFNSAAPRGHRGIAARGGAAHPADCRGDSQAGIVMRYAPGPRAWPGLRFAHRRNPGRRVPGRDSPARCTCAPSCDPGSTIRRSRPGQRLRHRADRQPLAHSSPQHLRFLHSTGEVDDPRDDLLGVEPHHRGRVDVWQAINAAQTYAQVDKVGAVAGRARNQLDALMGEDPAALHNWPAKRLAVCATVETWPTGGGSQDPAPWSRAARTCSGVGAATVVVLSGIRPCCALAGVCFDREWPTCG